MIPEHFYRKNEINENQKDCISWYAYGTGTGAKLCLCAFRAVLSGFMFGNAFSIIYSLAGCILSFIVMYLLKKSDKFSSVSISLVGGVCHNIGQIIVAAIVLSTYSVVYYIPVLLVAGCITGLVIGIVASQVLLRISDSFHV